MESSKILKCSGLSDLEVTPLIARAPLTVA